MAKLLNIAAGMTPPPREQRCFGGRDVRFGRKRPIWPYGKVVGCEILQAHGQPIFGRIWPYSSETGIRSI